jgi:hypothetical protein
MSPLERRLLAALEAATSPEHRASLLAELAGYWARAGEADRAEIARLDLRREFGDYRSPRVSVLIIVLEALQAYYGDLSPHARDRMLRASLLSKGFRDPSLIALTSAWMAHIELNHARFDSMVSELTRALQAIEEGHSDQGFAQCRIALTLGDANLMAGLPAVAQSWYDAARREANEMGDHAAIGAMTYNRAALRVARVRFDEIAKLDSGIDRSLLRVDVDSAINYQTAAQLRSLEHLLTTARASLWILQEQFEDAASVIPKLLNSDDVPNPSVQRLVLEADLALALGKVGHIEDARPHLESCVKAYSVTTMIPTDDQCLIASSVCEAARLCDMPEVFVPWEAQLAGAVERHSELCSGLIEKLSHFSPPVAGATK